MANKIILVLPAKSPVDVKADNLHSAMMGLIENSSLWGLKGKGKESLQVSYPLSHWEKVFGCSRQGTAIERQSTTGKKKKGFFREAEVI